MHRTVQVAASLTLSRTGASVLVAQLDRWLREIDRGAMRLYGSAEEQADVVADARQLRTLLAQAILDTHEQAVPAAS